MPTTGQRKYVAKVELPIKGPNKYRYFYDNAEYQAYLDNLHKTGKAQTTSNRPTPASPPNNTKTTQSDNKTNNSGFSSAIEKGKSFISGLFNNASKTTKETVAKWKQDGENFISKLTQSAKSKADAVGKNIDKAIKDTGESLVKNTKEAANKALNTTDKLYAELSKYVNTAKKDNIYDVNSSNYKEKMSEIEKSKEWQDIVARKDPEYCKRQEDGTYKYMLDDYVVKKKHPILDVIEDLVYGRKLDINDINKESVAAGVKDYVKAAKQRTELIIGAVGMWTMSRFKYQQGSYDEEIDEVKTVLQQGSGATEAAVKALATTVITPATSTDTKTTDSKLEKATKRAAAQALKTATENHGDMPTDQLVGKITKNAISAVKSSLGTETTGETVTVLAKEVAKKALKTSMNDLDPATIDALVEEIAKQVIDTLE